MTRYYIVYTNESGKEMETEYHWAGSFNEAWLYALSKFEGIGASDFNVTEV